MQTISLLSVTSVSQLALFLGIGLILFGWIEKKENLVLTGQAALLLLGVFSLWVLSTRAFQESPIESAPSKEVKILAFLKFAIALAGIDVVSLVLYFLKSKLRNASLIMILIISLMLFFMIFSISQMAG